MNAIFRPICLGKNLAFRLVEVDDASFILSLRVNSAYNEFLSPVEDCLGKQQAFIQKTLADVNEHYFIITTIQGKRIGTIRVYDIRGNSFCWGSWILNDEKPPKAALESAIMLYDYAFFALHYDAAHFDVRKDNVKVVSFHTRFGARITGEDDINYYFEFSKNAYLKLRNGLQSYVDRYESV